MKHSVLLSMAFVSAVVMAEEPTVLAFWQFNHDNPLADSSGCNKTLTDTTTKANFASDTLRFYDNGAGGSLECNFNFSTAKDKDGNTPAPSALTIEFFIRYLTTRRQSFSPLSFYNWNPTQTTGVDFWAFYDSNGGSDEPGILRAATYWAPGNKNESAASNKSLADFNWHHVAYVIDRANTTRSKATMYVDGVAMTTTPATSDSTPDTLWTQSATVRIGGTPRALGNSVLARGCMFSGEIDDVRICAGALAPEQFLTAPTVLPQQTVAGENEIVIPANQTLVLEDVLEADKITVEGFVRFKGEAAKLKAREIVVANSGILAPFEAFDDEEGTVPNRVWLECEDLTVDEGGWINANSLGYIAAPGKGYGPGGLKTIDGSRQITRNAAHGGESGSALGMPAAYDDVAEPVLAGSSGNAVINTGSKKTDELAQNGGGVVRIDATGVVTVRGRINADAYDISSYSNYGNTGASAGGSVLIYCSRLVMDGGEITARGGSGAEHAQSTCGGGGRIALHWNTEVQTADDLASGLISARAGTPKMNGPVAGGEPNTVSLRAFSGTVWIPSGVVLTAANLPLFEGRLVMNQTALTVTGDLTLTHWLGFGDDGFTFTVNGDLIFGDDARLDLGPVVGATKSTVLAGSEVKWRPHGTLPCALNVTGDLTMAGASRLDVYAGANAGGVGATVNVGGVMTVGASALVYPFSHMRTGERVDFNVGSLDVQEGATIGLVGTGYTGRGGTSGYGYGKGSGSNGIGAGYGGEGAHYIDNSNYGMTYGDAFRPLLAGSAGSSRWNGSTGQAGSGGTIIHVVAAESINVAGTIAADGEASTVNERGYTAGSGGSILLEAPTITCAETAVVSAKGGNTNGSAGSSSLAKYFTAAGGGGRIMFWTGVPYRDTMPASQRELVERPAAILGTVTVAGGADVRTNFLTDDDHSLYPGGDGTIVYYRGCNPKGTCILIR